MKNESGWLMKQRSKGMLVGASFNLASEQRNGRSEGVP
jgi:hypothetical protein